MLTQKLKIVLKFNIRFKVKMITMYKLNKI